MSERLPPSQVLLSLTALRDRALAATTLNALAFSMANDVYPLLDYRQALVMAKKGTGLELLCVSGLAKPTEDSPYLIWLARASRWLLTQIDGDKPQWVSRSNVTPPEEVATGWREWWPEGVYCVPLKDPSNNLLGVVFFLLAQPPADALSELLEGLWQTWAYCWSALTGSKRLAGWRPSRMQVMIASAIILALLLIPVRQTALAPAEIVSRNTQIISSPIDGVIASIDVRPNQTVSAGMTLFTLDKTTLSNRAEVLDKEVAVAEAELIAASQRAFDNPQSKSELTLLNARVQQRRSELTAVESQLKRTVVTAPSPGVAVYSDPNDWIGKPVSTGERILQVADPDKPAMLIELPVADAIALEPGAEVTLYLTTYPLQPLRGSILETSYKAKPGEDGVVAYRLLASIESAGEHTRLGLHGTAKLYGDHVMLGYYLLRRPLSAFRAWTGW